MDEFSITSHSVAWLTDAETSSEQYDVPSGVSKRPTLMPEDVGKGFFEVTTLKPGMAIARGAHQFQPERSGQLIPIAETTLTIEEPALVIQSAAAGRAFVKDSIAEKELTLSTDQTVFQHLEQEVKCTRIHDASQPNDLFFLILTQTTINELLGEDNAQRLISAIKLIDTPSADSYKIPHSISRILHSGMTNQLTGDFRKLYLEGRILQYLSTLSSLIIGDPERITLPPRRTKIIHQLHEELINLQDAVPNLGAISEKYGLSARTLNNDFKKEFGQSIYAYVKDHRLNQAYTALRETDIPIKVIAARLGYAHVTNFMLAFKKKYGCAPGSLRR